MILGEMSIINYFEKVLSWDLLVQGFFMINVFITIFLLLKYMIPGENSRNESFFNFLINAIKTKLIIFFSGPGIKKSDTSKAAFKSDAGTVTGDKSDTEIDFISRLTKITQFLSLGSIVIILSFITGVICSEVSDTFMDQSNYVHLGLKKNWADGRQDLVKTDEYYKINVFYKVFGKDAIDLNVVKQEMPELIKGININNPETFQNVKKAIISQIYYEGKHQILENDKWKDYLSYSQNLVNLNQTFCLSSWILLIFSVISLFVSYLSKEKIDFYKEKKIWNYEFISITLFICLFLVNIFLDIKYAFLFSPFIAGVSLIIILGILFRKIKGFRTTTAVIFVMLSLALYHLTAIAWRNCEEESNSKTYGLIRHFDKDLNEKYYNILKKSLLEKQ